MNHKPMYDGEDIVLTILATVLMIAAVVFLLIPMIGLLAFIKALIGLTIAFIPIAYLTDFGYFELWWAFWDIFQTPKGE